MAGSAWSNQAVIAALVDIIAGIPGTGLFVYSGPPASGNLVASIAAVGGTDPFGNHYSAGFGTYNNTFGTVGQLNAASLSMFAGVNQTVSLGPGGLIIFNSHGATIFSLDESRDAFFLYADTGSASQGALIASIANATGTDSFGNAFVPGIVNYNGSGVYAQLDAAELILSNGALTNTVAQVAVIGTLGVSQSLTLLSGTGTEAGATQSIFTLTDSGGGGGATLNTGNLTLQNGKIVCGGVDVLGAGNGLAVKEGSNAKQGTATLSAGTKLVSNTSVTANSRIFLTAQDNNSTGSLRISARTAGTSFTITSSNAADSGVVAFQIFEPG